jgi:tRNA A-37 threonylcarbamoyl transferase component Bud32
LLHRWEESQRQGKPISSRELCADCPHLLAEVEEAIRNLRQVDTVFRRVTADEAGGSVEERPGTPSLEGFAFLRCLGQGAFGEVWLASDLNLERERAVKLLRRDRYTPARMAMLAEEARTMARLPRHRNRVQVHSFFSGPAGCFLVMEYVEGGPLSRLTSPQTPMAWERAARYVGDVADGLVEAHAAGLLHRDIKPANILWDRQRDEALLGDFGLAAYAGRADDGLAGTKGYMAPELDGGSASPKSDVFSLAATLFCLVTGQPPFDTENLLAGLHQARAGLARPVPALSRVPRAVEEVILAGLEPDPGERVDLETFTARLRGAHLQTLADKLLECSRPTAGQVNLRVSVWAADERELVFRPVACERQVLEPTRNFDFVPEPAPAASVRTGDLLRLEVTADADGYLTVLNLGSSGELEVVFPNPLARDNRIQAGRPHRLTVKLTPPPGTDRAAIIWTRHPSDLTPAGWRNRIETGQVAAVPPRESVRGMDFVLHEAAEQPGDNWTASVVTVSHRLA